MNIVCLSWAKLRLVAFLSALLLCVTIPARAGSFTFTTIMFPGSSSTSVSGINDSGQVVGNANVNGSNVPFVESNGVYSVINVPGAEYEGVSGINNAGTIVGWFYSGNPASTPAFGYIDTGGVFYHGDHYPI